jgi:hypothetical protein
MTESGSSGSSPAFTPLPGRNGSPIPIGGASVRIGQGPQNDVVIDDDTVSTSHARLEYVEGVWRLSDLGSRNGTFVDGERIPAGGTVELVDGVPVAFGGVKLLFAPGSGIPRAPAAPPASASAPSVPLADRPRFRLPVWLLLVIILVIATIITLVILIGGAVEPAAANVSEVVLLLGFQIGDSGL